MTFDDTLAALQESLAANHIPKDTVAKVIRDLRKAADQEKAAKVPTQKQKSQLAILVSDPEGRLKGMELIGWVVQMEADAPPQEAYHRVLAAACHFNRTKRGAKAPLETLGDAMEVLRGKALTQERTDQKLAVKTRTPCAIQAVPNALPKEAAQ